MIREQIKKDLQKAIEKSGVLSGNFLDSIEWLLKTVNKDNFEDFVEPIPVGRLHPEVQKVIGAEDGFVYLKPRIYAKIRNWWEELDGHPEITPAHFLLLPLVTAFPQQVLADKKYKDRFLLVCFLEHTTALVVEVATERNEVVTFFWMREDQPQEHKLLWEATAKEKRTSDGRTCIPSVLAPATILLSKFGRVAGSRFPSLRQKVQDYITTVEKECQVDFLTCAWAPAVEKIHLEHPANPEHGDYSSNIALMLAKEVGKPPMEVAADVVAHFSARSPSVDRVEVAPPGFINFYLKGGWLRRQVGEILEKRGDYGLNQESRIKNQGTKVQVEFVSANPTGPLHIGNARGGFCGDVLANVLEKVGCKVQREYYINDRGVQVDKLAESVRASVEGQTRASGLTLDKPEGGYSGEYVGEIARKIHDLPRRQAGREKNGEKFKTFENLKSFAISEILKNIKKTVQRMGTKFDNFFSEQSLYDSGYAQKAIDFLRTKNLTYEKEGAVWFKSSQFGDEKDRVLIKSDGEMTYLVSDLAYHLDKFERRKFDRVILFWGADHHGYVPRFMAMMEAIGHKGKAQVELIQLLKLARGGKEVKMSKRAGEFVTVDDVLDEIGLDAARFHFLVVPLNTPMTLDLEKAKEQSEKNPVFYVQYAHARLSSILRKSNRKSLIVNRKSQISKLEHPTELALIRKLTQLPEVVVDISESHGVHPAPFFDGKRCGVHRLPQYATEIADAFHRFYENCRVLSDDTELTAARLGLVKATQIILAEALSLMGISAPERM